MAFGRIFSNQAFRATAGAIGAGTRLAGRGLAGMGAGYMWAARKAPFTTAAVTGIGATAAISRAMGWNTPQAYYDSLVSRGMTPEEAMMLVRQAGGSDYANWSPGGVRARVATAPVIDRREQRVQEAIAVARRQPWGRDLSEAHLRGLFAGVGNPNAVIR